jgi:hypothetical protein
MELETMELELDPIVDVGYMDSEMEQYHRDVSIIQFHILL